MCICGYCKYHNDMCYKDAIRGMVVIWSCCHDVFLLSRSFIINTTTTCLIKLHGKCILFSTVLLVIGVIEHEG